MSVIAKKDTDTLNIKVTIRNKTTADGTSVPYEFKMTIAIIEDIITFPPFTGEYPTATPPETTILLNAPYIYGPLPADKTGAPIILAAEETRIIPHDIDMLGLRHIGMKENTYYRVRLDVRFPTTGEGRTYFSIDVIMLSGPTVYPELEIIGMVVA